MEMGFLDQSLTRWPSGLYSRLPFLGFLLLCSARFGYDKQRWFANSFCRPRRPKEYVACRSRSQTNAVSSNRNGLSLARSTQLEGTKLLATTSSPSSTFHSPAWISKRTQTGVLHITHYTVVNR